MVTEHCLIHNKTNECTCHLKATRLIDKTGAEFPVIRDGDSCRSVLLNGKKLSWLDRQDDLAKLGLWATRLYFTTENSKEVDRVLNDYMNPEPLDPARVPGDCTYGVWNKIPPHRKENLMQLILASASPRRKALLSLFHLPFAVRAADIDETMDPEKPPFDEVARVSRSKRWPSAGEKKTSSLRRTPSWSVRGRCWASPTVRRKRHLCSGFSPGGIIR
mgnify:CR=1 FL=1